MLNLYQGELVSEIPKDIKLVVEKGREQMSKNPFIQKTIRFKKTKTRNFHDQFPSDFICFKSKRRFYIEVSPGYVEFEMVLNSPNKNLEKSVGFTQM